MAFYTDWYDYVNTNDFLKLPQQISSDAKTEDQRRPQKSEIYLMLNGLSEIYSQNSKVAFAPQVGKVVSDTLIELGKAAQTKESYRKALTEKENWIKYCALFSLVFYENQASMLFLHKLCEQFKTDVKLTDLIMEQHNIFLQRQIPQSSVAKMAKELKANVK